MNKIDKILVSALGESYAHKAGLVKRRPKGVTVKAYYESIARDKAMHLEIDNYNITTAINSVVAYKTFGEDGEKVEEAETTSEKKGFFTKIWEWIKATFRKIGEFFKKIINWFKGLFKKQEVDKQKLEKIVEAVETASDTLAAAGEEEVKIKLLPAVIEDLKKEGETEAASKLEVVAASSAPVEEAISDAAEVLSEVKDEKMEVVAKKAEEEVRLGLPAPNPEINSEPVPVAKKVPKKVERENPRAAYNKKILTSLALLLKNAKKYGDSSAILGVFDEATKAEFGGNVTTKAAMGIIESHSAFCANLVIQTATQDHIDPVDINTLEKGMGKLSELKKDITYLVAIKNKLAPMADHYIEDYEGGHDLGKISSTHVTREEIKSIKNFRAKFSKLINFGIEDKKRGILNSFVKLLEKVVEQSNTVESLGDLKTVNETSTRHLKKAVVYLNTMATHIGGVTSSIIKIQQSASTFAQNAFAHAIKVNRSNKK